MQHLIRFLKDEEGATLMEYSLISFLISLASLSAMVSLEVHLITLFPA